MALARLMPSRASARILYSTAQIVRITGDDDQKRKVAIYNGEENDPRQQQGFQPDPEMKDEDCFDIGAGEYGVRPARTNATSCSRNSWGYGFLVFGIVDSF